MHTTEDAHAESAPESEEFNEVQARAADLAGDPEAALDAVAAAERKARRNRNALAKVWDDLQTLFAYLRDSLSGGYRPDWKMLTLALAAVLYVLSPLDLVPDFLVGIGFLDDVAVVAWAVSKLRSELDAYRLATSSRSVGASSQGDEAIRSP